MLMAQENDSNGDKPDFGRGRPEGPRREQRMERIPDLSDEQKEKMEDIHLTLQKDLLPIENQIGEKEARLNTLQTADKVDMKAIYATIDEISGLRAQEAKKKAEAHQSIRGLLTEDQRIVFDSSFHPGPGEGPGQHHGDRGGNHIGMGRSK